MNNLWKLYDSLLETKNNPKNIELYDWHLLENSKDFSILKNYINNEDNLKKNFKKILEIVKQITLNKTGCYCRTNCLCYDYTFCTV